MPRFVWCVNGCHGSPQALWLFINKTRTCINKYCYMHVNEYFTLRIMKPVFCTIFVCPLRLKRELMKNAQWISDVSKKACNNVNSHNIVTCRGMCVYCLIFRVVCVCSDFVEESVLWPVSELSVMDFLWADFLIIFGLQPLFCQHCNTF